MLTFNICSLDNRIHFNIDFDMINPLLEDFQKKSNNIVKKISKSDVQLLQLAKAHNVKCLFTCDYHIEYMICFENETYPVYICKKHLLILIKILENILNHFSAQGKVFVEEITFEDV